MKDLNYQLSEMCRDNRDGSFSTQATRSRLLDLIASQLLEIGFRRMQPRSLKPSLAGTGHRRRDVEESFIGTWVVGKKNQQAEHHCRGQQRVRHR